MNEQEYLELGRIILDYPLDIQVIKELHVATLKDTRL